MKNQFNLIHRTVMGMVLSTIAITTFGALEAEAAPRRRDFDRDGVRNRRDRDDDNDGVRDRFDRNDRSRGVRTRTRAGWRDFDGDGIRNSRDRDDDNDGIRDSRDRNDRSVRSRVYGWRGDTRGYGTRSYGGRTYGGRVSGGPNYSWRYDLDRDGIPDRQDRDVDGDGRRNGNDDNPRNPRRR